MEKNKPAVLTASLLNPEPPPQKSAPMPDASPFYAKGSASAAQFRPDPNTQPRRAPVSAAPLASAEAAGGPRRVRLSFAVKPGLHRRIRQAAEVRGQSVELFLFDALDAAIRDRLVPVKTAPRTAMKRALTLSFAIDRKRQAAMKRALARSRGTQQGLLQAAVEAHVRRPARTKPLLPVGVAADAEIIAFPRTGGSTRRRKPEKAASCRGIGAGAFAGGSRDRR